MGRRRSSRDDQVLTPARHEGPLAAMSSSPTPSAVDGTVGTPLSCEACSSMGQNDECHASNQSPRVLFPGLNVTRNADTPSCSTRSAAPDPPRHRPAAASEPTTIRGFRGGPSLLIGRFLAGAGLADPLVAAPTCGAAEVIEASPLRSVQGDGGRTRRAGTGLERQVDTGLGGARIGRESATSPAVAG